MTIASIINAIETGAQYIDAEANATFGRETAFMVAEAFGGDLNAAVRFVREKLPDAAWSLDAQGGRCCAWIGMYGCDVYSLLKSPARALLLAALRAMEAIE